MVKSSCNDRVVDPTAVSVTPAVRPNYGMLVGLRVDINPDEIRYFFRQWLISRTTDQKE